MEKLTNRNLKIVNSAEENQEVKAVSPIEPNQAKALMTEKKLFMGHEGQLYIEWEENRKRVFVKRCFPWSNPLEYISLRSEEGDEELLVKNLSELSEESRKALCAALEEAGFCFLITNLLKVEEDFELRNWQVETVQGLRNFQTKLMEWPKELSDGGLLIRDVFGDHYYVQDTEKLPEPGRSLLWSYID